MCANYLASLILRRLQALDAAKQQQHHPLPESAIIPALRGTATRQLGDHTLAEMPRTANDGADLLTASDQPKVSPTNASAIAAVEATSKKRDIGEMISQISWDQTDIAHEFKLEKVHNRGWRCCCAWDWYGWSLDSGKCQCLNVSKSQANV